MTIFRASLIAAALLLLPLTTSAQSTLATSDATAFMGNWELGLDTPQGPMAMTLALKDVDGKVAAEISAPPMLPDVQKISDVSKDGTGLLLKYMLEAQGMQIPTKILLAPAGDGKWTANFDFIDGQFTLAGTATKK
ncbi:MAG: hypothetical protein ACKOEC_07130 [Acidimicrobiia bacterium]